RAVHNAAKDLRPARVAWGSRAVWGQTRIRSLPALLRNIPLPTAPPDAPAGLAQEYRLVDPELTMLRVDLRDAASGAFRPAGAFTHALWEWRAPTATHLASCRHAAREAITVIGKSVGDGAVALFDALGATLTDRLELGRAFATLALRDSARALGICAEPAVGLSTLVGADDAHTRI